MISKATFTPEPLRVAVYIRVSSAEQARHGDSLRDQLESGKDYVNSNAHMILQDIYVDDGISGQKLDRGEFTRLMENVKSGLIDLIVFTKIDRWFRSLRHYLNTQAVLEDHHVNWLAIQQPYFDTSTPHGRAFIAQSMMWAELEAQNDSVRIRDVFANKAKYGEVLSGKTPRGYSIVDKHLKPNEEAPMIYDLFCRYRDTGSLRETLEYLRQAYHRDMTLSNLRQSILMNKKYIGVFRENASYCPPLVPDDLFYQVQDLLAKNVKAGQRYPYLFSGMIFCGECGGRMSGCHINVLSKGKYRYRYPAYQCGQHKSHKGCPNGGEIRESRIEEYLLQRIGPEIADCRAEYRVTAKSGGCAGLKIKDVKGKLVRLKELYLDGCITMEEFKRDQERMTDRLTMLQAAEAQGGRRKDIQEIHQLLNLPFEATYAGFTEEEKRRFWRAVVDKILIGKSRDRTRQYQIIFL